MEAKCGAWFYWRCADCDHQEREGIRTEPIDVVPIKEDVKDLISNMEFKKDKIWYFFTSEDGRVIINGRRGLEKYLKKYSGETREIVIVGGN